jgi:hypothetical protein
MLDECLASDERDEHGRRFIPGEEVMADFERGLRVEVGSTRAERRTWRRRVSRARYTENIARTVVRGSFGVPHIEICSADLEAEPRVIEPPWHRRAGLTGERHDGPVLVTQLDENAPEIEAPWALTDEIQQALDEAWEARLRWEDVEPRLRAKYAHVWVAGRAREVLP